MLVIENPLVSLFVLFIFLGSLDTKLDSWNDFEGKLEIHPVHREENCFRRITHQEKRLNKGHE